MQKRGERNPKTKICAKGNHIKIIHCKINSADEMLG